MDMEKEMLKMYTESKERLESISAFELMEDAKLFMKDLDKLTARQSLPVTVLIGCLMSEISMLNIEADDMLRNARLEKIFMAFKRYADEKFIRKEEL